MAKPGPVENSGPAEMLGQSAFGLRFVAREREITRLCELHSQRKHVLIIGPAGVGKSGLRRVPVIPSPQCWGQTVPVPENGA